MYTHRCPSTVALRGGSVFSAAKLRALAPRRARPAARGGLIAIQAAQQEQLQLVLVGFTLIIDDIVDHTGRTYMAELGGGGPQTLFGFQLSSMAVGEFAAPRFASNSLLDHGATPVLLQSWTCKVGHDGVRVFTNPRLALCNKLPPTHLLAVVCDPYLTNAGGGARCSTRPLQRRSGLRRAWGQTSQPRVSNTSKRWASTPPDCYCISIPHPAPGRCASLLPSCPVISPSSAPALFPNYQAARHSPTAV